MFKARIKLWGLEKKHKEGDMVAVLRKKNERDAVGKKSLFRVHDRDITMEEVFLYFTRKGGLPRIKLPAPATPPNVSCWTPSPVNSPVNTPLTTTVCTSISTPGSLSFNTPGTAEEEAERIRASDSAFGGDQNLLLLATSNDISNTGIISTTWTSPFTHQEFVIQLNRNNVQEFFSDRSFVSHSPSLPQTLLVSENMLYSIKEYFENSCRNMILDEQGNLLTPGGAKLNNDLCNDFDSYCFNATMFIEKGLYIESRRALSKASALIEPILRAQHPRTFACFLEVLIHLLQTGLPEVASILRNFIQGMAAKVTTKQNPWGNICRLLGALEWNSLEQAMAQFWKCSIDTFESELGTFNRLAVSVRLDYIKRVYGATNYPEEERLLRDLLAQTGNVFKRYTPRVMLNLAHNLNRQGRYNKAEELGQEVLSLVQKFDDSASMIVERIDSLKLISRSQHFQEKRLAAEQTLREAISMIVGEWGVEHPWVTEFMNVLEGWLRGWGCEDDANILRAEINMLIGKDEIDEQQLD